MHEQQRQRPRAPQNLHHRRRREPEILATRASANVRIPVPVSSPINRPTTNPIPMPARISPNPSPIDHTTTVPLFSTALPRILSSMKHGSITV